MLPFCGEIKMNISSKIACFYHPPLFDAS